MSTNDKKASAGEQGEPQNDSVYDFLYHDTKRIGSLLAQFDDAGHLQQIRQSESAKKGHRRGYKLTAGANVPIVGGGNVGFEKAPHDEGSEASERIYDPLWSNALTLLDYLGEANLINRDLTTASLGQFVIASGALSVLNAGMLVKLWESPDVRATAIRNATQTAKAQFAINPQNALLKGQARQTAEKALIDQADANAKEVLALLPQLQHAAQCTVTGANFSVWSSLLAEGMITSAADLSMKHGADIPGTWHLLGILDAQPNPIPPQIPILPNTPPQHMGNLIRNFANVGRRILGRSEAAFGMTALLLFREIST